MFLILPKTLLKFFSWAKFDEDCWNCHMVPVYSRAVLILPSGAKGMATILPLICYYFALIWKIDTTSLTCKCGCIHYLTYMWMWLYTGWNAFVDRIWPAGRSLETPGIQY